MLELWGGDRFGSSYQNLNFISFRPSLTGLPEPSFPFDLELIPINDFMNILKNVQVFRILNFKFVN